MGFRYVVIDKISHEELIGEFDVKELPAWLRVYRVMEKGSMVVYRLDSVDAARTPNRACRRLTSTAWQVAATQ